MRATMPTRTPRSRRLRARPRLAVRRLAEEPVPPKAERSGEAGTRRADADVKRFRATNSPQPTAVADRRCRRHRCRPSAVATGGARRELTTCTSGRRAIPLDTEQVHLAGPASRGGRWRLGAAPSSSVFALNYMRGKRANEGIASSCVDDSSSSSLRVFAAGHPSRSARSSPRTRRTSFLLRHGAQARQCLAVGSRSRARHDLYRLAFSLVFPTPDRLLLTFGFGDADADAYVVAAFDKKAEANLRTSSSARARCARRRRARRSPSRRRASSPSCARPSARCWARRWRRRSRRRPTSSRA